MHSPMIVMLQLDQFGIPNQWETLLVEYLYAVHPESYFSKAAAFDLIACVAEILLKGKTG